MKSLTLEEFKISLPGIVSGVVIDGDIIRVDCGKIGAFVVMHEPEYEFLWDAVYFLRHNESANEALRRLAPKE